MKVLYKTFLKGLSFLNIEFHSFGLFSVEQAITKMTKGELAQLKLKFKATTGIEKFNIPANTPVQYEVTLLNFEKVRCLFIQMIDYLSLLLGERNLVNE